MFFFFKQKTAYEMRISDWSSDVCSSDLVACKPSQLLVIDLDQAKEDWNLVKTEWAYVHQAYGPRVHGEALLDEMKFAADGDLPKTYEVLTGSGGIHIYYQWPAHWPRISQASPVKGVVDVRRSEERRVGKEGVRTCRSRWSPEH